MTDTTTVDMTTRMGIVTVLVRSHPMILLPAGRFPVADAAAGGIAATNE